MPAFDPPEKSFRRRLTAGGAISRTGAGPEPLAGRMHRLRSRPILCILAAIALPAARAHAADPLERFAECTLQPARWSDGDSFPVKLPDGRIVTVRLYGVDCLEMHLSGDDSNARRLRDQRRWFGIADILEAKSIGEAARRRVAELLAKPFTVHTAFADARGDVRYPRIYAFVFTAEGKNLAEQLVAEGLARAFGVARAKPDGTSAAEWREQLRDLELRAAKRGAGAWALTDWERLPEERRLARAEEAELAAARDAPARLPAGVIIDPNTAARDELLKLPGIGETLALRIIEHRPYKKSEDLLKVPGIGEKRFEILTPHLKVGKRD